MSDQTNCSNTNNNSMVDDCDALSCYLPRKRIKLTPNKNRNARSLTDKIQTQSLSNSWKFIDKNETMIAELSGGKLTLWQFLLELLMSDEYSSLIKWTDRNIGEFILIQAEEVAKLWGIRKDRNHRMNYDKLSRALRYYYQKNIIKKVHGHKFVYRFVSLVPESITSPSSSQKAITSGHGDISPHSQPIISISDSETTTSDNCNSRSSASRVPPPMSNLLRLGSKNNKKNDFNSTLTALFQAALLSLSGSNPEIPPAMFANHKTSEPRACSPDNVHNTDTDLANARIFDIANQNASSHPHECVCKPEMLIPPTSAATMFFPGSSSTASSIHMPPFDRQSMLHFSRHSINMQRLSQEILLNATSKSRFNPCLSNPLLSSVEESITNNMEQPNHNFWLNQFAKDLCKSTANNNTRATNADNTAILTQPNTHDNNVEDEDRQSPEILIKSEKSLASTPTMKTDEPNTLTVLFQKFVKEIETKTTKSELSPQYKNYSHSDLANLIKSQLSSHSSFVWMPVPVNFAEEIMDFCVRSSLNQSP